MFQLRSRFSPLINMLSLALARRIARPSLAGAVSARWYAAAQAKFSTDGERVIHQKLTEKFTPSELHVEDVSGEPLRIRERRFEH